MAEPTTIRAEQIEGLSELVREEVRGVLREEARPPLQDMEEIRRSPAGILIRLEEQLKALEVKMDQRFAVVDQRFVAVDQRFVAVDQRFAAVDQRFDSLEKRMDHQFTIVKWALGLLFPLLLAILGKLFLAS